MSGRLVLGPMTRGLFEELRLEVVRWTAADPLAPGVVLVGSNLLGLQLRRRLALEGVSHAGLRFLTFADLGWALAAPRLAGRAPLPPGGRVLIARALATARHGARTGEAGDRADARAGDEAGFGPVAERPGFHRCLATTFGDLDDGGFADAAAVLASRPDVGGSKVREALALYADYRRRVEPGFFTTSDTIRLAALDAGRFGEQFGTARLALYGFYDFTEIQRRLLAALARSGRLERLVAFSPDPDLSEHGFARGAVAFLRGLGLEQRTLDAPAAAPPRLDVVSAPGEVEEAREIARAVLCLARDEGIAFNEMAILLRFPEVYTPLLREAFEEAGVPFYAPHGLSIATSPTGRAVRLLLGLAGTPLRRADVIEFLTAAPLAPERAPSADVSPALWDLVTRRAGIVEGRATWVALLGAFARSSAPEREIRAARTLLATVSALFEDIAAFPAGREAWSAHADRTRSLLRAWIAPSKARDTIETCALSLAANDRLTGPATLQEFRETLLEAMDGISETVGAFEREGVTVSDLPRARGLAFRAVFIPGLVERGFPAPPSQDPILLDADRERLTATGEGALPQKLARAREEDLRFALACAAAEARLAFSYPRFETGTSRERTPSPFVVKALAALEGRAITIREMASLPRVRRVPLLGGGPLSPDDALSASERRVAGALGASASERRSLARALAAGRPGLSRALRAWDARWGERDRLNEYSGALSARALRGLLGARPLLGETLSPSAMETYAACPYRYFLKEALRLAEVPEPERTDEIDSADRGRLAHRILENLYAALARDGLLPLDAKRLPRAEEALAAVARELFADAEARGETGFPLLWELTRERLLAALRDLVRREAAGVLGAAASRPVLEAQFGAGGEDEALARLENGRVLRFRGAIDRLDLAAEGARFLVIDYKTHWDKPRVPSGEDRVFRGGETLQLPVYLLAAPARVRDALGPGQRVPRGVGPALGLFSPTEGEARYVRLLLKSGRAELADVLTTEALAGRRADFESILETIASGIESGLFPVFPKEGANCERCDYKSVCGPAAAVTRLYDAKARDVRFASFHAMKEAARGAGGREGEDDRVADGGET